MMAGQIRVANLKEFLNLGYPNVCLSAYEVAMVECNPELKKDFYPITKGYSRVGIYKGRNSQSIIWRDFFRLSAGQVKIALKNVPQTLDTDWTENFSIVEKEDVLRIYKHMKLKVFW